jgi:hypothetical protein
VTPVAKAIETKKFTKAEVEFEHPAKGKDRCGDCIHFAGHNSCRIVAGLIYPRDWCNQFERAKT